MAIRLLGLFFLIRSDGVDDSDRELVLNLGTLLSIKADGSSDGFLSIINK